MEQTFSDGFHSRSNCSKVAGSTAKHIFSVAQLLKLATYMKKKKTFALKFTQITCTSIENFKPKHCAISSHLILSK